MDTTAAMVSGSSATGSSPAEDSELWAAVLSDPLYVGVSFPTPPTEIYATYEDYGTMEDIQQLLQGPQNEHDLERLFEGPQDEPDYQLQLTSSANNEDQTKSAIRSSKAEEQLYLRLQLWSQLTSPTNMTEVNSTHQAVQATTEPEKLGTCTSWTVDLLDYIPRSDWRRRCRRSGHRTRRTPLGMKQMLLRGPFAEIHGLRKNNEHWTLEEVTKLVDGIEDYGVGPWTQLKKEKFPTSVRTAMNIKDKWRNLVYAYTAKPTSKKKENSERRLPLDEMLINQIKKLARKHPYPKSSRASK